MELRPLGRTGIRVSRFCLGAMIFGGWGNRDDDECSRIIHTAHAGYAPRALADPPLRRR